jgi:transposase
MNRGPDKQQTVPKKSFTQEQILTILRAVEAGVSAVDTCRKFGITQTTITRKRVPALVVVSPAFKGWLS